MIIAHGRDLSEPVRPLLFLAICQKGAYYITIREASHRYVSWNRFVVMFRSLFFKSKTDLRPLNFTVEKVLLKVFNTHSVTQFSFYQFAPLLCNVFAEVKWTRFIIIGLRSVDLGHTGHCSQQRLFPTLFCCMRDFNPISWQLLPYWRVFSNGLSCLGGCSLLFLRIFSVPVPVSSWRGTCSNFPSKVYV